MQHNLRTNQISQKERVFLYSDFGLPENAHQNGNIHLKFCSDIKLTSICECGRDTCEYQPPADSHPLRGGASPQPRET